MQTIIFDKTSEVRKNKALLEEKLNINMKIIRRKVIFEGPSLEEYEASLVLDAINIGFSAKKALSLKEESKIFRVLNIKNITRKKNLEEVRARVIGSKGKTKRTLENISNCEIVIKGNEMGIIGEAESIENTITGISNLIRGTKEANTYRYLEKINRKRKLK